MVKLSLILSLTLWTSATVAQIPASISAQATSPEFEVATIKPAPPDTKANQYIVMQGNDGWALGSGRRFGAAANRQLNAPSPRLLY